MASSQGAGAGAELRAALAAEVQHAPGEGDFGRHDLIVAQRPVDGLVQSTSASGSSGEAGVAREIAGERIKIAAQGVGAGGELVALGGREREARIGCAWAGRAGAGRGQVRGWRAIARIGENGMGARMGRMGKKQGGSVTRPPRRCWRFLMSRMCARGAKGGHRPPCFKFSRG